MKARWLGINGFEFDLNGRTILLDPCVTRGDSVVMSSPELIRRHIRGGDDIFVGHAHWDHIVDVPGIAAKTGGRIYGSKTALNICRAYATPESQLCEIHYGDHIQCDGYSVEVIKSEHKMPYTQKFYDEIPTRLAEHGDFRCGEIFNLLFHFPGQDVLCVGSANLDEETCMGLKADTLFCGVSSWQPGFPELVARCLTFKKFIPTHHDKFTLPLTEFVIRDHFETFRAEFDQLRSGVEYFQPEVLVSFEL